MLEKRWAQLHAGDREPYPQAAALRKAWRSFHRGDFLAAIREGDALGAPGVLVSNKAAAIHTLYLEKEQRKRLAMLRTAVERGEDAVRQLPDYANAHYALALVLGRYSQRITILEALAAGYASKIRPHLERTLELQPKHAEAHIALGLFHAELVKTLGSLAARLTYGASADEAMGHFRKALRLAPRSIVAHLEYAHGLHMLDAGKHRRKIDELWANARSQQPLDRMEELDLEHLQQLGAA